MASQGIPAKASVNPKFTLNIPLEEGSGSVPISLLRVLFIKGLILPRLASGGKTVQREALKHQVPSFWNPADWSNPSTKLFTESEYANSEHFNAIQSYYDNSVPPPPQSPVAPSGLMIWRVLLSGTPMILHGAASGRIATAIKAANKSVCHVEGAWAKAPPRCLILPHRPAIDAKKEWEVIITLPQKPMQALLADTVFMSIVQKVVE
ncbi:hypothetical protein QBC36DRAFT_379311 [Triangularia setosa]|uniref:Uncharacterized protein n=1 Tax=Triangularia setosa TaxID=2587417 RepID=A0AAN6W7C2_9PEZI|nr:hypothetical protein QBC36DRAFT_379311 [Podospora setosa]